jgi:outer membrane biosynthesis protein TonB
LIAAHPVPAAYRQPLFGGVDPELRRALAVASGIGALVLLLVWLAPAPPAPTTEIEALPERFARLILEEKPAAPTPASPAPSSRVEEPVAKPTPEAAAPRAERPVRPRTPAPRLDADRGTAGREQARTQVVEQLAAAGQQVEETLQSLAAVLPTAGSEDAPATPTRRGGRTPRRGRSASQLAGAGARGTTSSEDLTTSTLAASATDLGTLGAFDLGGVAGDGSASDGSGLAGGGTSTGDRSAATLMGVVRRYAAGIRYCYDSALESDAALRGKMVFRITVARDGSVTAVEVVEDSLGSSSVRSCALAQMEAWRFGAAAKASVFDAPFVFRPTD